MKQCHKTSCLFAFTYLIEQAQNYGCLLSPYEIINMRVKYDKTWACHSNPETPCKGAIHYLKENNLPHKVIDKNLITETDTWNQYAQ